MNKKIIAIIIPLMMVLSGVVVAANTVADDSPSTSSDTSKQSFTVGESFYLNVNEANYTNYTYTAVWKIGDTVLCTSSNTVDGYTTSPGSSAKSNGVEYSIVPENTLGNYKIITKAADGDLKETVIVWKITVTINPNSDNSKFKEISISKTLGPTAAEKLTFSWTSDKHNDPRVNTIFDEAITANLGDNNVSTTYSDVSFYAVDLPEGLSMSSDGHINGIAKKEGKVTAKIAVSYLDGKVKKIATGLFDVNVVKMGDIAFTMSLKESGEGSTSVPMKDGSFYISVESTYSMNLTVTPTDGWKANAHVKVVSSNGVVSDESKFDKAFDIPVKGTGAYTVIVTYAGVTQSFTLYVLPAGALSADIIISGN